MKLITKIEVKEVPRDPAILINTPYLSQQNQIIYEEIIYGRRFTGSNENGVEYDFIIGATSDVDNILGIYYNGWKDLEEKVDYYKMLWGDAHSDLEELKMELGRYKNMSFWERIKWIFKK